MLVGKKNGGAPWGKMCERETQLLNNTDVYHGKSNPQDAIVR